MKNTPIYWIVTISFLLVLTSACSIKNIKTSTLDQFENITLIQNNKSFLVKDDMTITLKSDEFSFEFYNKRYNPANKEYYATSVGFSFDNDFENYQTGDLIADLPFFRPGTGMASHKSGFYECIFMHKDANHYLFYENETDRRLVLVEKMDHDLLKLRFDIKKIKVNGVENSIEQSGIDQLYVAVLIDRNLNGIVEKNELTKLLIQFKP